MTDAIDASARLAALQAFTDAQAILEQHPNLTAAERNVVIGNSLVRAYDDYLASYTAEEGRAAFRNAVAEVCKELDGGSIEQTDDADFEARYARYREHEFGEFSISPKEAARLLHERRRGDR